MHWYIGIIVIARVLGLSTERVNMDERCIASWRELPCHITPGDMDIFIGIHNKENHGALETPI